MRKFSQTLTYDAPPADVHAMLADPAFREKVSLALNTTRRDVSVTPDGDAMEVVVDQTQPADGIPSFARKVVGDEINIVQTEAWESPTGASLDVAIPGKPGSFKGTIALVGDGSGTTETVAGEVKVSIPLVGGKLEDLISDLLSKALRTEQRVGRAWLAGDR